MNDQGAPERRPLSRSYAPHFGEQSCVRWNSGPFTGKVHLFQLGVFMCQAVGIQINR